MRVSALSLQSMRLIDQQVTGIRFSSFLTAHLSQKFKAKTQTQIKAPLLLKLGSLVFATLFSGLLVTLLNAMT